MTLPGLPLLLRVADRPVILIGEGEAADAKRRLLERAGAEVVADHRDARLAIVAVDDDESARGHAERLRARGLLVNVVDRPELCDFTVPAIVDRSPVVIAIATGGASAGLAAALRQRIETLLPAELGRLAEALHAARDRIRARWPDGGARRRAIADALSPGGPLDPFREDGEIEPWLNAGAATRAPARERIVLRSADPDDLTLREARLLASADAVVHTADVPPAILDRARADAVRLPAPASALARGLTVELEIGA